jgi:type II secretory pathway pseudopilin PulG
MRPLWRNARCSHPASLGFSIIEAVMVLLIVVVVVASLTPGVMRTLTRARINRASGAVAADLFLAQSLAARQRAPVRVVVSSTAKTLTLRSRGDTVLQQRFYGSESEFKLPQFSASPDSVQVLPNGMTNTTLTITLSDGTFIRRVKISRAGQIRVLRN